MVFINWEKHTWVNHVMEINLNVGHSLRQTMQINIQWEVNCADCWAWSLCVLFHLQNKQNEKNSCIFVFPRPHLLYAVKVVTLVAMLKVKYCHIMSAIKWHHNYLLRFTGVHQCWELWYVVIWCLYTQLGPLLPPTGRYMVLVCYTLSGNVSKGND